jgi:Ala-tRNA(Pro) deacylase
MVAWVQEVHDKLVALLEERGASFRVIEHEPEGVTEAVSRLRGNDLGQAAKCIVIMVKHGKKTTRYVLATVPGDRRVDLAAIKARYGASYVSFAAQDVAENLAGSHKGTIVPFVFDDRMELVVDPALLEHGEIYFNAARLNRSIALATSDYVAIAQPRIEAISQA